MLQTASAYFSHSDDTFHAQPKLYWLAFLVYAMFVAKWIKCGWAAQNAGVDTAVGQLTNGVIISS